MMAWLLAGSMTVNAWLYARVRRLERIITAMEAGHGEPRAASWRQWLSLCPTRR